jgi:wobble nucleotide-excising tRNase
MPNIARRLLESFLSFRQPQYNSSVSLDKRLQDIQFDEAKKGRILRFTNTLSHNRYVEDQPINDLSILGESPAVLTDLLSLMAFLDEPHCKSMEGAFE